MGFQNLHPPFTIVKIDSQDDQKLPSAATCFNRFNLPKYSNAKILQKKFQLAISQGMGFYLA